MREEVTYDDRGWGWVDHLYDSLDELADTANKFRSARCTSGSYGAFDQAVNYAHNGWDGRGDAIEALDIVREAVRVSTGKLDLDTVSMRYDVAGGAVDMGRYLAADPECMVAFPLVTTSRVGKVIRLCASVDAYAGQSLYKRGLGLVALTEALTKCGHAVELYLDVFCNRYQTQHGDGYGPTWGGQIRCLIKGANDRLDLSKVMFGYAYDDTMRQLGMAATHAWPEASHKANKVGAGYGNIGDPRPTLPEGTLYIPHMMHGLDLNPEQLVMTYLVQLGLAKDPGNLPKFSIWQDSYNHGL